MSGYPIYSERLWTGRNALHVNEALTKHFQVKCTGLKKTETTGVKQSVCTSFGRLEKNKEVKKKLTVEDIWLSEIHVTWKVPTIPVNSWTFIG